MLAGLFRGAPRTLRALPLGAVALALAATGAAAPHTLSSAAPAPAPAPAPAAGAGASAGEACSVPLLPRPMRLQAALHALGADLSAAAAANGVDVATLRAAAPDRDLWLDECGRRFYVDQAAVGTPTTPTVPRALVPLEATFGLESRPGATRTIFLDFSGGTIVNTAWNKGYGARLAAEPFSTKAPVDTSYSADELVTIQQAWQVVAEDFAPFDVNVTTRDPGAAALDRTDLSDQHYGVQVLITHQSTIFNRCRCAGLAYVGLFGYASPDRGYYLPAWVFTRGTGPSGRAIGEAASHEAGHTLGLSHHGSRGSEYYAGHGVWGPVMGAAYSTPLSQWSRAEFPGASNRSQDDVAVIVQQTPVLPDDHADDAARATPLAAGTETTGLITTRTDVDAFGFTAGGATTVTVTPTAATTNLDIRLQILDATGRVVATLDPPARRRSAVQADGLDARWSATLPGTGRYVAVVDGAGLGSPSVRGQYSDYGSLGGYAITLTTNPR